MSDIALNSDWDIDITGSDLTLTTGADAIKQHISQRLKTWYGEWFLDMERGIPYLQQIFKKNPNPIIVDSVFKREIINTPGILQLKEFSLDLNPVARELSLAFKALCTDGIISFEEVIP